VRSPFRQGAVAMRGLQNRPNPKDLKPCPVCGYHHIVPGTPQEEWQQADACRMQMIVDIEAERMAWYENHW